MIGRWILRYMTTRATSLPTSGSKAIWRKVGNLKTPIPLWCIYVRESHGRIFHPPTDGSLSRMTLYSTFTGPMALAAVIPLPVQRGPTTYRYRSWYLSPPPTNTLRCLNGERKTGRWFWMRSRTLLPRCVSKIRKQWGNGVMSEIGIMPSAPDHGFWKILFPKSRQCWWRIPITGDTMKGIRKISSLTLIKSTFR